MIRIITYILATFVLISCAKEAKISNQQEERFFKFYGGALNDDACDIIEYNNIYYVLGTYGSVTKGTEILLMRLDKYGNFLGEPKTYGDILADEGVGMIMNDASIYIVGNSADTTNQGERHNSIFIIKATLQGDTIWTKKHNTDTDETASDITINAQGQLAITGSFVHEDGFNDLLFLLVREYTDSVSIIENLKLGVSGNDEGIAISPYNGGYIIIGNYEGSAGNSIKCLLTNSLGVRVGEDVIEAPNNNLFATDVLFLQNEFLILGTSQNKTTLKNNILLRSYVYDDIETSNLSTSEYIYVFNDAEDITANSIIQSSENEFIIAGEILVDNQEDFFLRKISADNKILFTEKGGDEATDEEVKKVLATDNGYVLIGTSSIENNSRISIVKTSFDGVID